MLLKNEEWLCPNVAVVCDEVINSHFSLLCLAHVLSVENLRGGCTVQLLKCHALNLPFPQPLNKQSIKSSSAVHGQTGWRTDHLLILPFLKPISFIHPLCCLLALFLPKFCSRNWNGDSECGG